MLPLGKLGLEPQLRAFFGNVRFWSLLAVFGVYCLLSNKIVNRGQATKKFDTAGILPHRIRLPFLSKLLTH